MGDQHRRDPHAGEHVAQPGLQVGADRGVQGGEGLVEQHHRGVDGERPAEGDALGLPAGEFGRQGACELGDAEVVQQFGDPLGAEPAGVGGVAAAEGDVLGDGEPGEEVRGLRDERRQARIRAAVDASGLRLVEVGQQPHQGRLPRPGGAEHAQGLVLGDLEVQVLQHGARAAGIAVGDPVEREAAHACPSVGTGTPARASRWRRCVSVGDWTGRNAASRARREVSEASA